MGNNKVLYILSILTTVGAYYININNLVFPSIFVVLVGVILSFYNIKKGSQFFFIMALAFTDYTFEGVLGDNADNISFGGIYMANIGGVTLMVYWALINLTLIILNKSGWVYNNLKIQPIFKVLIFSFLFSFIGFFLNSLTPGNEVLSRAISDIRIYVNLGLGFLSLLLIINSKEDLYKYFNVFIFILLTQILLVVINSYIISQTQTIYTFYSGTETYLIGIPLVYFLFLYNKKNTPISLQVSSFYLLIGIFVICTFAFIVPSRGRLIALIFGLFLYLIYSKKWYLILVFPFIVFAAIYTVQLINPYFYDYFLWKISTINPMAEGASSSRVRYIEAVNIFGEIFTNPYHFVFGKGFGGFFKTDFMTFTNDILGGSSYPASWILEGRFYQPHGTWLYFLLKNGFVMTCLLYYFIFKFFKNSWISFKNSQNSIFKIIGLSVIFILPIISIMMFSSKLQIMFGFLIAFSTKALQFTSPKNKVLL